VGRMGLLYLRLWKNCRSPSGNGNDVKISLFGRKEGPVGARKK